jgi:hypothetical protein
MMQLENSETFVRAIKGAPASILWAFFFTRRAMTALELQEWTGYKGDNITVALRLLVNLGWLSARSARGPWCLSDGRQFPLMAESDLIGFEAAATTAIEERKNNREVAVVSRRTTPIKSELLVYDAYGVTFEKNLKACQACGIGEPKASKISAMPWVSPEFIKGHIDSLYADERIGLAILRIESNELPRAWLECIPSRDDLREDD